MEVLMSSSKASQTNGPYGTMIYHIVNPNTTSWSSLAPKILALYPKASKVRAVQFSEWIKALGQGAHDSVDPEKVPAVKLLDFYRKAEGVGKKDPRMLTSYKAEAASKTLRCAGAVCEDCVRNWMQQWDITTVD